MAKKRKGGEKIFAVYLNDTEVMFDLEGHDDLVNLLQEMAVRVDLGQARKGNQIDCFIEVLNNMVLNILSVSPSLYDTFTEKLKSDSFQELRKLNDKQVKKLRVKKLKLENKDNDKSTEN
jgi:hypothetical protein